MSHSRKMDDYEALKKEYEFARWFWALGADESLFGIKLAWAFGGFLVGLLAFFALNALPTTPIPLLITMGVIIGAAVLVKVDIRGALFHHARDDAGTELITAYEELRHYFLQGHPEILYIENGRDLTGVGLFKLTKVPLVIKGNFERFIRSLYQQQLPIFWTYTQAPVDLGSILDHPAMSEEARGFYNEKPPHELESRVESHNGMWAVRLLIGTRRTVSAYGDIEEKRMLLYNQLTADLFKLHTAFTSAYAHTALEQLHGKELIKAHSIAITGGGIPAFF